jgi:hypothetical protein
MSRVLLHLYLSLLLQMNSYGPFRLLESGGVLGQGPYLNAKLIELVFSTCSLR